MSAQETVNAVVAQLGKAKAELLEKIADLQLQLDDAKVADVVDLSELVAVAQALDDIVPDESEEPAEEPVEDPVVVEEPVGDVAEDAAGDAPPF